MWAIYIWVMFIYTNKLAMYIHGLQYTTYFLGCTSDHWAFWQDLEYIVVPHIIKSYLEGDQEVHLGSLRQPDMAMQKKSMGKSSILLVDCAMVDWCTQSQREKCGLYNQK